MREIKFRAKGNVYKKWIYSNGYYFDGINYWFTIPNEKNSAIAWADNETILIETLGQYTSRRDKNGKEIYEGDILKHKYSDDTGYVKVIWHNFYASMLAEDKKGEYIGLNDLKQTEVIGNIYENPDLLKML